MLASGDEIRECRQNTTPVVMCDSASKRFEISPERFDKPFPEFERPKVLGLFSKNYLESRISTRSPFHVYFYERNVGSRVKLDLNAGYNTFISRGEEGANTFASYLQWFEYYFSDGDKYSRNKPDFFCGRGMLTKFLKSPYEQSEDWTLLAEKLNGTIFLLEGCGLARMNSKMNETEKDKEMTYWGFKFEQYMTTDKKGGRPVTNVPVDNTTPFYSVVSARMDNHHVMYGGEVDCCSQDDDREFVELKISRKTFETMIKYDKYYKLIRWWAQSTLLGVAKIVCGYQTNGIVERIEEYQTSSLPDAVKKSQYPWKDDVCFNCCNEILHFIRDVVDEENKIYSFKWTPGGDVTCDVVGDVEVLPAEFRKKFSALRSKV